MARKRARARDEVSLHMPVTLATRDLVAADIVRRCHDSLDESRASHPARGGQHRQSPSRGAAAREDGTPVSVATTGREALAELEAGRFDLAILDMQMPEVDGIEATTIVRAKERDTDRHLPIIAMTAHAMVGDRERCLRAGMDGYVPKPINPTALAEEIQRVAGSATR